MDVRYEGPPARVYMVAGELRKVGYVVEFDPPEERRGAALDTAVEVVLHVILTGDMTELAPWSEARRVLGDIRRRLPGLRVDIQDDEAA